MRDKFVIYTSFADKYKSMTNEQFGALIRGLIFYQSTGEIPEFDDMTVSVVFSVARYELDLINNKYDELCKKRKEIGSTGGAPKGNQNARKQPKTTKNNQNQSSSTKNKQNNHTDIDIDINTDIDIDTDLDSDSNGSLSFSKENDCQTQSVRQAIDAWNSLEEFGIVPVKTIHSESTRMKHLKARIKQEGIERVLAAIENIKTSDFLLGKVKDFIITFDWFVKPNNFAKVADGNYNKSISVVGSLKDRQNDFLRSVIEGEA